MTNKFKPILFNTEMVQTILEGRKTATRRIIKPTYREDEGGFKIFTVLGTGERWAERVDHEELFFNPTRYVLPAYHPGDILYVRETWAFKCCLDCMDIAEDDSCMLGKISTIHEDKDSISEGCYIYRADYPQPERIIWQPSIHMSKAAARIWLEVTHTKIQRLQEMTLDEFLSEGVAIRPEAYNDPDDAYMRARHIFTSIWDSTIQPQEKDKYGWDANPWVWVYDFKQCEKPESEGTAE